MDKVLVAYFSPTGTTREAAEKLAKKLGADAFEILPAVPYTEADLDWRDANSRSTVEMKNKSFRPELAKGEDPHIEQYDVIYVGFPIWWYVAPTIINTFLEVYDFSGKKVVLFATSGGSGWGKTLEELKPSVDESCVMEKGELNGK